MSPVQQRLRSGPEEAESPMSRPGLVTYAPIVRLLTMSIVWLVLLIWQFNAYRTGCGAAIGFLSVLGLFLLAAGVEHALLRRRALVLQCLNDEDRPFDLFSSPVLMAIREGVAALVLAAVLLVSALTFEARQWSVLFIDLMMLSILIPRVTAVMGDHVRRRYRYAIARRWAMMLSVLLLWGEAVLVLMFSPPEDYFGMRWQEVVTYGVAQPDVLCPLVQSASEVYTVGQALAIWAVQNAARVSNDPTQVIMVWVGYGVLFGFSLVVAVAYSRALVGVMARPWEMRVLDASPVARNDGQARAPGGPGKGRAPDAT
jgi:hypothetical protein